MSHSDSEFIQGLRHSSRYIEQHRGKTFVIYLPGQVLESATASKALTEDVSLLHNLGIKLVLVMGAGPQIDAHLKAQGLSWQTHQQFRITSEEILAPFQQAVAVVKHQLEAGFSQATRFHSHPISLTSGNWVTAQPKGVIEGVDYQHTGKLRKINHQAISHNLNGGQICLLTPVAFSLTGELFNLNTFEQACQVATAIKADKLMVFTPPSTMQTLPKQLSIPQLKNAIEQAKNIKEQLFLNALLESSQQVKRIHLMDETDSSAMLLELFTRDGKGTLIFSDRYHQVRQACIEDVGGILDLITPLEEQAILVKRSRERLELEIENFIILQRDQDIIGCAALYPHADDAQGELACLAVHPDYQGQQLGSELLSAIEAHALQQGFKQLFLLTTITHHWFIEHGFIESQLEQLPESKQALYNLQRNSKILIKPLAE